VHGSDAALYQITLTTYSPWQYISFHLIHFWYKTRSKYSCTIEERKTRQLSGIFCWCKYYNIYKYEQLTCKTSILYRCQMDQFSDYVELYTDCSRLPIHRYENRNLRGQNIQTNDDFKHQHFSYAVFRHITENNI